MYGDLCLVEENIRASDFFLPLIVTFYVSMMQ